MFLSRDATLGRNLIFTTAASKIIPGATSLSHRNNADSADNLLISDAGVVTIRSDLKLATAVSKIIPGATSLSLRNNADSADNLIITDAGVATFRGAVTTTQLSISTAAGKIIPGATSLVFRNNADSADNLTITNAGSVTVRTDFVVNGVAGFGGAVTASAAINIGASITALGGVGRGIRGIPTLTASANSDSLEGIRGSPTFADAGFTSLVGIGVYGISSAGTGFASSYGLRGNATGAATTNYGVYATASGGSTNWAGYLDGNAVVAGGLNVGTPTSAATGTIKLAGGSAGVVDMDSSGSTYNAVQIRRSGVTKAYLGISLGTNQIITGDAQDDLVINGLGNILFASASGLNTERMRIVASSGNLKIAGTAARGTTEGTNHLDIFNGTAPVGTLTNGISLYATSGELRVMDSGGTATLLSPHAKDGSWIYDSYCPATGKHLRVEMERMVKFLATYFKQDWVEERKCLSE